MTGGCNSDNNPTTTDLIELYKVTSEESRHWNGINMQMWMALGVITSLLLLVVSFVFTKDFQLREPWYFVLILKIGLEVLFAAILTGFWFIFWRINGVFKVCENIEEHLQHYKDLKLLVTASLRPNKPGWYSTHRLWVYAAVAIVAAVCFGFFLFVFIEPCYITIVP